MDTTLHDLEFVLNGERQRVKNTTGTLHEYLQSDVKLKGTKAGCLECGCGSCTVVVSFRDINGNGEIVHEAWLSCSTPLCILADYHVITIEGLTKLADQHQLHPIQKIIAENHGSQCGYCTPGVVMSLLSAASSKKTSPEDIEEFCDGNVCRCTGYRPILEGARQVLSNGNVNTSAVKTLSEYVDSFLPVSKSKLFSNEYGILWFHVTNITEVLSIVSKYPLATIIRAPADYSTSVRSSSVFIYPRIAETMKVVESVHDGFLSLRIGSSVSLSTLLSFLKDTHNDMSEFIYEPLANQIHKIGGPQLKNMTAIGSVILPPWRNDYSDILPILVVLEAKLEFVRYCDGETIIKDVEDIFENLDFRSCFLTQITIKLPIPNPNMFHYSSAYRIEARPNTSSALLSSCLSISLIPVACIGPRLWRIQSLDMCISGVEQKSVVTHCCDLHSFASGKELNQSFFEESSNILGKYLQKIVSKSNGIDSKDNTFLVTVSVGCLVKFLHSTQQLIKGKEIVPSRFARPITQSKRIWNVPKQVQIHSTNPLHGVKNLNWDECRPIGDGQMAVTAYEQTKGSVLYVGDIPIPEGCLHASLVMSTIPHGKIISIDVKEAMKYSGVIGYYDKNDLAVRAKGEVDEIKEQIFAVEKVSCVGQVIGVVVAISQDIANCAARLVKVKYEEFEPVLSLEDAIAKESFFPFNNCLNYGDFDNFLKQYGANGLSSVSGSVSVGGQEHFYLEPHTLLVVPRSDEIDVYSCTQCHTKTQNVVAGVLGIPQSKVAVHVQQIGGAFGGKELRATFTAGVISIPSYKLRRPIRICFTRRLDMQITGGRHPFKGEYNVVFRDDGKIEAVDIKLYSDGGNTNSTTYDVMNRALFHALNAYSIPNVRIKGYCCRTHKPGNTAFRGFGAPQAMYVCETMIERVAGLLSIPVHEVRRKNLLKAEAITHYGQTLSGCPLQKMWDHIVTKANVIGRMKEIEEFNKHNQWRKRSISVIPTMYGISFPVQFLNQSSALVICYPDGSVRISHGGTEMGQGLNTKCIQIAAQALGVSIDKIHISEAGTDKAPNTPPTAASVGSDINGMAVLNACEQIISRLAPLKEYLPKDYKFADLTTEAWKRRISMASMGYYATPNGGVFDWVAKKGNMFNYFVYGVGVSEVELDAVSGSHTTLRSDILMDLGTSMNPAIDIGQIEGAFMQGYGYFTCEELNWAGMGAEPAQRGLLLNSSPHTYHVPDSTNTRAIHSSKAVGEPPLFLASTVAFALQNAILEFRKDLKGNTPLKLISTHSGLKYEDVEVLRMHAPITTKNTHLACLGGSI